MTSPFLADALALQDMMVHIRRDLHMHPELGFQEVRTARIVAEQLGALGYEVITGVGKTGVVGLLSGAQPGERTVLLRFDMDALPIHEENDVPYRSQTPGVMHACGHDGHVAIGLGVASVLAKHREVLGGTIKLMFQPAEEIFSGANAMIADGVLRGPDVNVALGLHVSSVFPTGMAVVRSGGLMAAADRFDIQVRGRGGHGAHPEQTVDAVLVAATIVTALQSIVARNLSADEAGVVTVGSIHAGDAFNVIPAEATLVGTIRSFEPAVRDRLHRRVREIAEGIAGTFGATAEVTLTRGCEPTINAEEPTRVVQVVASAVLGPEQVNTTYRTLGGEDFGAVLANVPGNFFFLGARDDARNMNFPHHNARFDFDEGCMPQGVAILAEAAVRCLRQ